MTIWQIVEPITVPVDYSYPDQKTPHSKEKFGSKDREIIEKPVVDVQQLQERIKTLGVGEGRTIREVCAALDHRQKTVRSICRTFKIGPYADVGEGNRRAVSSQTPYGWTLVNGLLKPMAAEMRWVEEMKSMRAHGDSLHAIARALNEQQVPTKNKGRWHAKTVSQIFKFNCREKKI